MIKTLSPYYVTTPFVSPNSSETCTSYTLNIYVWSGASGTPPGTPSYQITRLNPTASTGNDSYNIGRILNSFLDITPQEGTGIELIDGVNQKWVKITAVYTTSDISDDNLEQNEILTLMVRGYAYGIEGSNTDTPANLVMLTGNEFRVSRGSFICLPLEMYSTQNITVQSQPANEIDETIATASTTQSDEAIKYLWINTVGATTDTYIEVTYNGVTIYYDIIEECRYTPLDFMFFNKEGCQQSITFFKQWTESLNITSDKYETSSGQPINGVHQFNKFNVNGTTKIKANTGFMIEDNNETFKQFMLSEKVWLYQGGLFKPVNITSTSFEYKTRQKDRLINYEIEFEYAFNEINNS